MVTASAALLRLVPSVTVPCDPRITGRPSDAKLLRLSSPLYCRDDELSTYFVLTSAPIGCNLFFESPGLEERRGGGGREGWRDEKGVSERKILVLY